MGQRHSFLDATGIEVRRGDRVQLGGEKVYTVVALVPPTFGNPTGVPGYVRVREGRLTNVHLPAHVSDRFVDTRTTKSLRVVGRWTLTDGRDVAPGMIFGSRGVVMDDDDLTSIPIASVEDQLRGNFVTEALRNIEAQRLYSDGDLFHRTSAPLGLELPLGALAAPAVPATWKHMGLTVPVPTGALVQMRDGGDWTVASDVRGDWQLVRPDPCGIAFLRAPESVSVRFGSHGTELHEDAHGDVFAAGHIVGFHGRFFRVAPRWANDPDEFCRLEIGEARLNNTGAHPRPASILVPTSSVVLITDGPVGMIGGPLPFDRYLAITLPMSRAVTEYDRILGTAFRAQAAETGADEARRFFLGCAGSIANRLYPEGEEAPEKLMKQGGPDAYSSISALFGPMATSFYASVHQKKADRARDEAVRVCAPLRALGLAIEWGMMLGQQTTRWKQVHPAGRVAWDTFEGGCLLDYGIEDQGRFVRLRRTTLQLHVAKNTVRRQKMFLEIEVEQLAHDQPPAQREGFAAWLDMYVENPENDFGVLDPPTSEASTEPPVEAVPLEANQEEPASKKPGRTKGSRKIAAGRVPVFVVAMRRLTELADRERLHMARLAPTGAVRDAVEGDVRPRHAVVDEFVDDFWAEAQT